MNDPVGIIHLDGVTLTEKEAAAVRRALDKSLSRGRRPHMLTPLPARTRRRLWRDRIINRAAVWLCAHHATGAAIMLWRVSGMWS